ncbi:IgGFc-binding protein-like [Elgaria multicarinata webbii]|uniref:IgGFc-binding protein-like n=1 Tax=Elgaria multicarinata webbii TaxID=159646 RepID=UPI002FCD5D0F
MFNGDVCVPTDQCGCAHDGRYLLAGETIFSSSCTEKCTCSTSSQLTCAESSCRSGETCTLIDGVHSCELKEAQCKVSPEALLTSFDGATGKYLYSGIYNLAFVCDESALSWFRVLVSIGTDSDNGLVAVEAIYVFFPDAFIAVKKNNRTWVNGRSVKLPYNKNAVSVSQVWDGIVIDQASQVEVHLYPNGEVTVKAKKTFAEKLCAPCGNFNGDSTDDLKLPSGKAENTADVLQAWKAEDF